MSQAIAVIASEGIRLDAFLSQFEQSVLAGCDVHLLSDNTENQSAVLSGKAIAFSDIEAFDFNQVKLCIVLDGALLVGAYQTLLSNLPCQVLGFSDDLQALEPVDFHEDNQAKIVALYQPVVTAMVQVLAPWKVQALDATVCYPVSIFGQTAVEELASQTAKLLNGLTVEPKLFHTQMPFNYFPLAASQAGAAIEQQLINDCQQAFDDADVTLTAMQMPVFHGVSASLRVELTDALSLEDIQQVLSEMKLLRFSKDVVWSNYDMVQSDKLVSVSHVKVLPDDRVELWLGFDEVKLGFGQQILEAAEILLKSHL